MIFWRYLCSHWTYLLFNNSGGSRLKFGTSDHFLDMLQPVFNEIFGKVENGNTQTCCSITAHSWEGTMQTWCTCLHYFGKALQYCEVVQPHVESLPTVYLVMKPWNLGLADLILSIVWSFSGPQIHPRHLPHSLLPNNLHHRESRLFHAEPFSLLC